MELLPFGLFIHLYLFACRLLPLGLLRDKLLRLCLVALAPLSATSVTLLRVPPLYRRRESLSSTPAAVLSAQSDVVLVARLLPMLLSRLLSELLSRLLSDLLSRLLSEVLLRLLSRQLPHCPIR